MPSALSVLISLLESCASLTISRTEPPKKDKPSKSHDSRLFRNGALNLLIGLRRLFPKYGETVRCVYLRRTFGFFRKSRVRWSFVDSVFGTVGAGGGHLCCV